VKNILMYEMKNFATGSKYLEEERRGVKSGYILGISSGFLNQALKL